MVQAQRTAPCLGLLCNVLSATGFHSKSAGGGNRKQMRFGACAQGACRSCGVHLGAACEPRSSLGAPRQTSTPETVQADVRAAPRL